MHTRCSTGVKELTPPPPPSSTALSSFYPPSPSPSPSPSPYPPTNPLLLSEKFNSGGTEQPLPSVVAGSEQQWMAVSPLSVPLWLPKGMEPYAGTKDVFYLVVTPENPHIINNINYFFKELSTVYEVG